MVAMQKFVEEVDPGFFQEWSGGRDDKNIGFTFSETSAFLEYILAKREGLPALPVEFELGEFRRRG